MSFDPAPTMADIAWDAANQARDKLKILEKRIKLLEDALAAKPGWDEIQRLERRIDNAIHGPLDA